jgi:hypothetical protein
MNITGAGTAWAIRPEKLPAIAAFLEARAAGDQTTAQEIAAAMGPSERVADQRMLDSGASWDGGGWRIGTSGAAPTLLPGSWERMAKRHAGTGWSGYPAPAQSAAAAPVYTRPSSPRPAESHLVAEARRLGAQYGREYSGRAEICAAAWGWRVVTQPRAALDARLGLRGVFGYVSPFERTIFVGAELSPAERNLTVAHELGHALRHSFKTLAERRRLGTSDAEEVEAEAFATTFTAFRPRA